MSAETKTMPLMWLGGGGDGGAAALLAREMPVQHASAAGAAAFLRGADARCHLAAMGPRAADALALALEHAANIETLTLLAPPEISSFDAGLAAKLKALEVPTLVLFGAAMSAHPGTPGTQWRRALGKGHLVYVYGAGDAMDTERPEAVASLIRDFIARREGFLVRAADDRLHP